MLADWVAAGFDPAAFWSLTWREIDAVLKGALKRFEREHNERAWLAWHIAALGRVRRFPALRKLQAGLPPPRRQTPAEMIAVAQAWTRALARKEG